MRAIYAIIVLDGTVESAASIGHPGFRHSHDYKWLRELRVHYADGRFFNLAIKADAIAFNEISMNAFRAYHKYHYPVPRVLTDAEATMLNLPLEFDLPVLESGFDEPAPAWTPEPDTAMQNEPRTEPLITAPAKREAQRLNVDWSTVKGTGAGGIINKDDIHRAWHEQNGTQATAGDAGHISMAELVASTAPQP